MRFFANELQEYTTTKRCIPIPATRRVTGGCQAGAWRDPPADSLVLDASRASSSFPHRLIDTSLGRREVVLSFLFLSTAVPCVVVSCRVDLFFSPPRGTHLVCNARCLDNHVFSPLAEHQSCPKAKEGSNPLVLAGYIPVPIAGV